MYLFVAIALYTILHRWSTVGFIVGSLYRDHQLSCAKNLCPLRLVQSFQRELVEELQTDFLGRLPLYILKSVELRSCKGDQMTFLSIPSCWGDLYRGEAALTILTSLFTKSLICTKAFGFNDSEVQTLSTTL